MSVGEELTPSAATAGTTMATMISRSCRQLGLRFMHQAHYIIFSLLQPPRRLQQCDGKVMCRMQIPQPVGRHRTDASPSSLCLLFSSSLPCIVSYFFVTRCVLSGRRRAACVFSLAYSNWSPRVVVAFVVAVVAAEPEHNSFEL